MGMSIEDIAKGLGFSTEEIEKLQVAFIIKNIESRLEVISDGFFCLSASN